MTTDPFRLALRARPFQAFTIRTADGRDFRIDHPEMALLSAGGRTVAIAHPDMDAFSIVDLLLVTTLEVAQAPER